MRFCLSEMQPDNRSRPIYRGPRTLTMYQVSLTMKRSGKSMAAHSLTLTQADCQRAKNPLARWQWIFVAPQVAGHQRINR